MRKVRRFDASVAYRDSAGAEREESFPVYAGDYSAAKSTALAYTVQVLRLHNFELRIAGS